MMEFNTVNLELYSKVLSFSVVLNNWGKYIIGCEH